MAMDGMTNAGAGWSKWRIARWVGAAMVLTVPLIMMQISEEWHWGPASFLLVGSMLAGVLSLYDWAVRQSSGIAYRGGVVVALAASFLLAWVNMAVGIVGNEDNPTNLSFFCLILTAAVGAFAGGFRADGMARAMLGVSGIQVILGMLIATAPSTAREPAGAAGVLAISAFFATLWLVSAALFAKDARDRRILADG